MKRRNIFLTLLLLSGLAAGALTVTRPVSAQGPSDPGTTDTAAVSIEGGDLDGPVAQLGVAGPVFGLVCSTTDYTDVAAKALGMTAAELRVALVSGKTLNELATSKNVTLQTVQDALTKARQADLDQAVKDGLIPQQMANMMNGRGGRGPMMGGQNSGNNNDNNGNGNGGNQHGFPFGGIGHAVGGMLMNLLGNHAGYGISTHNVVRPYVTAAQAVGMSCADLVKALQQGDSIVNVATKKNVQAQTVIDALVKAYKDALAQDVKEGLITQAQADGQSVRLVERVTAFISRSGHMARPMMPHMFGHGRGGRNGSGNPVTPPNAPGGQATPQATPAR